MRLGFVSVRRGHDKFRALLVGAAAVSIVDRSLTHQVQVARLYDGHVGGTGEQHRQRHAWLGLGLGLGVGLGLGSGSVVRVRVR
eukprot:scaffold79293_cov60-Phaeocystis_antarctica.AAC.2